MQTKKGSLHTGEDTSNDCGSYDPGKTPSIEPFVNKRLVPVHSVSNFLFLMVFRILVAGGFNFVMHLNTEKNY